MLATIKHIQNNSGLICYYNTVRNKSGTYLARRSMQISPLHVYSNRKYGNNLSERPWFCVHSPCVQKFGMLALEFAVAENRLGTHKTITKKKTERIREMGKRTTLSRDY